MISDCIKKVTSQLDKSKHIISKTQSLVSVINNNLKNILNCKTTDELCASIIKEDQNLAAKVIKVMADQAIIEISNDKKAVKVNQERLSEFTQITVSTEDFKKKVIESIKVYFKNNS